MNADLGQFPDGAFVLMCDDILPHNVKRVEYYKDQKLMMLVYDDPKHEGDLMNCELQDNVAFSFERSASDLTIISNATSKDAKIYTAPIIQVGI